jgi:hypothetical protein
MLYSKLKESIRASGYRSSFSLHCISKNWNVLRSEFFSQRKFKAISTVENVNAATGI